MSIEAKLRQLEERAARLAADAVAGAVPLPDDTFVRDLAERLQARVALPDSAQVVVERSVDLRPDFRLGLPWRIFHAEHWMQAPPAKGV